MTDETEAAIAGITELTAQSPAMSSTLKGRHAELLATIALMANGWTIMEPTSPEAFDMAIKRPDSKRTLYVQVKTAMLRDEERYNGAWLVVKGAKNNGKVYGLDEIDYFIAVYRGDVYMFENAEKGEYWARPWEVDDKWTKLDVGIHAEIIEKGADI